jgi:hypothetical protein
LIVQNVQAVQPLRSVQIVLQPKNKFQSFHCLRGSKRNDSQSFAKEISPTGEGVNHIVKRGEVQIVQAVQSQTSEAGSRRSSRSTALLRSNR